MVGQQLFIVGWTNAQAYRGLCRCAAGHRVTPRSMAHGLSVPCPGCPVRPAVARTATVSSTPSAAVAVSGIAEGEWKPFAAACGADAAPISKAPQVAQQRPPRH